jgi:predicted amidophosphoribosyltransferase
VGGEAVVACEHCGHPLPADAKFCAGCGREAGEDQEVAAMAASEEPKRAADPWEG